MILESSGDDSKHSKPSLGVSFEDIEEGLGQAEILIRELAALGIVLSVEGDRLAFDAPEGVMTDAIVDRIRAHRERLIEIMRGPDLKPMPAGCGCPWCMELNLEDDRNGFWCPRCGCLAWVRIDSSWIRADQKTDLMASLEWDDRELR